MTAANILADKLVASLFGAKKPRSLTGTLSRPMSIHRRLQNIRKEQEQHKPPKERT